MLTHESRQPPPVADLVLVRRMSRTLPIPMRCFRRSVIASLAISIFACVVAFVFSLYAVVPSGLARDFVQGIPLLSMMLSPIIGFLALRGIDPAAVRSDFVSCSIASLFSVALLRFAAGYFVFAMTGAQIVRGTSGLLIFGGAVSVAVGICMLGARLIAYL